MLLMRDAFKKISLAFVGFGLLSLTMVSCINDPLDGGSFESDVTNTTLTSPSADKIELTASPDGSQTTITWPVVHGASGYLCSVYDVTNPDAPVVIDGVENKLVDGCSIVISRTEDTNYKFSILAVGNVDLNNKDAETATEVAFTTFVPAYATLPSGTDLYKYFQDNPLPTDAKEELPIDLESGGQYTVSGNIDFQGCKVTLRCTNKYNRPTVTYTENGGISTSAPMTIKNVLFNCAASDNAVISLSKTPVESIKGATGKGDYYNIMGALYISNCEFKGVNAQFIYDNNVKYCVENVLIDNTLVELTTTQSSGVSSNAIIFFKSGFANTLNVKNSTFYNTGAGGSDAKYFCQYNNSGRCDRAGYTTNYVMFQNCTFYNIAKAGQWCNYGGYNGKKTSAWVITNNIFVDCGNGQVPRRIMGGRGMSAYDANLCKFGNNTYWFDGAPETGAADYDAGNILTTNPNFRDAAHAIFTPQGEEQAALQTGDPRWYLVN